MIAKKPGYYTFSEKFYAGSIIGGESADVLVMARDAE